MKLELGKSYLTRDNKKVKIIKEGLLWPYTYLGDNAQSYTENGRRWYGDDEVKCIEDLIILWEEEQVETSKEKVNHPIHYNKHPSGVECITITEHMGFNLGSAVKYIWRADLKNDAMEDLKKAAWYIDREIKRRENQNDQIFRFVLLLNLNCLYLLQKGQPLKYHQRNYNPALLTPISPLILYLYLVNIVNSS